jgi:prophage regulatory protein
VPDTSFLRLRAVVGRTGLGRSTIYAKIAIGEFPRQVRIGARAVAWIEAEVAAWAARRIAASRPLSDGGDNGR